MYQQQMLSSEPLEMPNLNQDHELYSNQLKFNKEISYAHYINTNYNGDTDKEGLLNSKH